MTCHEERINIGKHRRLHRIFSGGKCILVPLDDSLISGPTGGLIDIRTKVTQIESAKPSALMAFPGTLSLTQQSNIPIVLNLTASTVMGQHTNKVLISSVEQALALGADAVALHINFSSKYESNMLRNVNEIREKCDRFGMPLMILAYPRKEREIGSTSLDGDYNYLDLKQDDNVAYTNLICHCVRIAFELGADIIRTQYTGDDNSFARVVRCAADTPILISGGIPDNNIASLFTMVEGAMKAGASGVSIGRYVFNNRQSDVVINAIKKIVFENCTAKEAESFYLNKSE